MTSGGEPGGGIWTGVVWIGCLTSGRSRVPLSSGDEQSQAHRVAAVEGRTRELGSRNALLQVGLRITTQRVLRSRSVEGARFRLGGVMQVRHLCLACLVGLSGLVGRAKEEEPGCLMPAAMCFVYCADGSSSSFVNSAARVPEEDAANFDFSSYFCGGTGPKAGVYCPPGMPPRNPSDCSCQTNGPSTYRSCQCP